MILVIDVGNTRLKWAWLGESGLSAQEAIVHHDVEADAWSGRITAAGLRPDRILVSNVAGEAMARALQQFCRREFQVEAKFMTPTRSFLEITNGYLNPSLLGADRWLAVIGAWQIAHSALCVVDAGTAVKVDSVNAHGRHLGGLILPGIRMMRESLLNKTNGIAASMAASEASIGGILADNTISAVARGAVIAAAAMADRAAEIVEHSTGEHPRLFITGGDAEMIHESMHCEGEIVPDLVLQGIAVIAAQTA